jgi:hypothetical protein
MWEIFVIHNLFFLQRTTGLKDYLLRLFQ